VTLSQVLTGAVRAVHVMPSGLVITQLAVQFDETATNSPPPQVTSAQPFAAAAIRVVQVTPSSLVITPLGQPTATKRVPLQATPPHCDPEAAVVVHITPSVLDMKAFAPVATYRLFAYVTSYQLPLGVAACVHVIVSVLVVTELIPTAMYAPFAYAIPSMRPPLPGVLDCHCSPGAGAAANDAGAIARNRQPAMAAARSSARIDRRQRGITNRR
jgi:hypothetical protein